MAVYSTLIVAVFNEQGSAERAIEQLYNAGVASNRISYSGRGAAHPEESFLDSLKNLFGGTHTHTSNNVMHDLSNMGLPDEEAQYYGREFEMGRIIVAVQPEENSRDVLAILQNHGGYHFHSPEGTITGGTQRTESGAAGYNQADAYEQQTGYNARQDMNATPGERGSPGTGMGSYAQGVNRPDYSGQPGFTASSQPAGNVFNRDVNAPDYKQQQPYREEAPSTENYGQNEPSRQGNINERNVAQPDYKQQQGSNAAPSTAGAFGQQSAPARPQNTPGQQTNAPSQQPGSSGPSQVSASTYQRDISKPEPGKQQESNLDATLRPAGEYKQNINAAEAARPQNISGQKSVTPDYNRPQNTPGQVSGTPDYSSTQESLKKDKDTTSASNQSEYSVPIHPKEDSTKNAGSSAYNSQPDYPELMRPADELTKQDVKAPNANAQQTPPIHPAGPAGPYSQGIDSSYEEPEDPNTIKNRESRQESQSYKNNNAKRDQKQKPER
ncbi:general stress protein [Dictyobacter kobayashii]|uniref:Uncharacterized protein n=1 Tax=Dictyobacter kobayashii TaxID=2014872 RepID=A0A402AC47_9CHLR|nr:general stress protein [Dictyobacter kobayashii]GCE16669.1 hypothetical protein KDK_04690 [Dictyobacter kobayashii]